MSPSKSEWIELLAPHDTWNERLVMTLFSVYGIPPSYADFGSGTGAMVNMARKLGVADVAGVDLIANAPDYPLDLTKPIDLGRKFNLVTSMEIAEHIPREFAGIYANNLGDHVKPGGGLIFTAAPPGQAGEGHVNLWPSYAWRDLLFQRGFHYEEEKTTRLRLAWHLIQHPLVWLTANLQIFSKAIE